MNEIGRIILEMSDLGWDVETKITGNGWRKNAGFMIWFKRSDWHGKFTYTLTGREVVFYSGTSNVHDEHAVMLAVKRAADRAKRAWDVFTNTIPCQNAKGDIIEDVLVCPFEKGKYIKNVDPKNRER